MRDLVFTIQPKDVGATATMASGKTVMDIIGVKNELNIPTGWLSVADLRVLRSMINTKHVLSVTYPDVDGDKTRNFLLDQPLYKAVIYDDDGVSQWCGVTITATQQGVD
nr:MAG TPA: hypothetical protein [Caudoviricetes sp.]